VPILVTDFDGTFTGRDFYRLILDRYDAPAARAAWQRYERGELSLFAGISAVFASVRTDLAGMDALIDATAPAPDLGAAVRRLRDAGWEIIVASAGCGWYIARFLERHGLDLPVHASPGDFAPETGLVMRPPSDSRFFAAATGIDKPAIIRDALARDPVVAYAGDSVTDREAALLVSADRRYATGWLAQYFAAAGVPFRRFTAWPEIAADLLQPDECDEA
jgi:HAD superfamily phosphoserine phosphatase-like hydrolase